MHFPRLISRCAPTALCFLSLCIGSTAWANPSAQDHAIGGALEAEHTLGLLSAENVHELAGTVKSKAAHLLASLPAKMKSQIKVRSVDELDMLVGFDLANESHWVDRVGVDAKAGLSLIFDARMVVRRGRLPAPLLGMKIVDQNKFMAFLSGKGIALKTQTFPEGYATVQINERTTLLMGQRKGFTFLYPNTTPARAEKFTAFLKGSTASLQESSAYQKATRLMGEGARLTGFGSFTTLASLMVGREKEMVGPYMALIPAIGASYSNAGFQFRVVSDGEGHTFFKTMLSEASPVGLGAFLPRNGWSALRASLNVKEFWRALIALVRPEHTWFKRMFETGQAAMSEAGVPHDLLSQALSGHILLAADMTTAFHLERMGPAGLPWFLALGLRDGTAADTLLKQLVNLVRSTNSRARVYDIQSGSHSGYLIDFKRRLQISLLRTEQAILIGASTADLASAIKSNALPPAKTSMSAALDDITKSAAFSFEMAGLLASVERGMMRLRRSERQLVLTLSQTPGWKRMRDVPLKGNMTFSEDGLTLHMAEAWGLDALIDAGISSVSGIIRAITNQMIRPF